VATSVIRPSWMRSEPSHRFARYAAITTRVRGLAVFRPTTLSRVGSHAIYVLHNLAELDLDPAAAGFTAVVSGHSHKPAIEERGEILFVNPGSAGPRRFSLPVTLAILGFRSGRCTARIVELPVARSKTGTTNWRITGRNTFWI
jgi:calcineurin-like phosphoesterase family protein